MNTTYNQDMGKDDQAGSNRSQGGNGEGIKRDTEELKAKATQVAQDATREGKAQVDQYRDVAASKVETIAESVKAAAAKLQEGDVGQWSTQISGMADSMTRFSQGLREKNADEIMRDANRLARENPAIFIGGAVAIGFGLTRLMRATSQPRPQKQAGSSADDASYGSSGSSSMSADDDAYTSSTITGSGAAGAGYGSGGMGGASGSGGIGGGGQGIGGSGSSGVGVGGTGSSFGSTGGSGTGVGTGSTGAGLSGASSQSGQSGFAGSGGAGLGGEASGLSGTGSDDDDRSTIR